MEEKRLLIVDDQPEIVEIIEELISDTFTCEIVTAKNSVSALEFCDQKKFNVICTDFIMPGLNGAELISMLRSGNGINHNTPVILLTGNEDDAKKKIGDLKNVIVLNKVEQINNILDILAEYLE